MDPMHPYERLPLFTTGLVLAIWLIASHAFMLAKSAEVQDFLRKFPRNVLAGQILLGIGLGWFWLLIAPSGLGALSALTMELGEFNRFKRLMQILVPVTYVWVCMSVRDFLAVRALGVCGLMVASPFLESAFLKDPGTRLLVPIFAYVLLTLSMFWVGMPYLFRDAVTWATASQSRWRMLCLGGLAYGIAVLACALAFWRGY